MVRRGVCGGRTCRARPDWSRSDHANVIKDLRFLLTDSWRAFGFRVPVLLGLMIVGGLLEGLALTAALPLLGAMGASGSAEPGTLVAFLARLPEFLGLPHG